MWILVFSFIVNNVMFVKTYQGYNTISECSIDGSKKAVELYMSTGFELATKSCIEINRNYNLELSKVQK